LNLYNIVVEAPQYETLTTSEKCKSSFDNISGHYIKLTHLLIELDNERSKLVAFLAQIQKQFKQLNANKESISNNEQIQQVVDKALDKEQNTQPKVETKEVKEIVNEEQDEDNHDQVNEGENNEDNDSKKQPVAKKKVVTKKVVKKPTQEKEEKEEPKADEKVEEPQEEKPKPSKKVVVKAKKPKAKEPEEEQKQEPAKEEPEVKEEKPKVRRVVKKKTQ